MHTDAEIEAKFWKAIKSDMTVMLGLPGKAKGRPMTAQFRKQDERGPIWFFTASDTELAERVAGGASAELAFVSKDHGVFATVHGSLRIDNDPEAIDELWNRYVAAWFEQGKDDPKLRLLRFDPDEAEIWLDASSLIAGLKVLLGTADPKQDYKDNVAKVKLA